MTTPTPSSATTPAPPATTAPATVPAPVHRSMRDRARIVSSGLFSKTRIYPVEITHRQHVLNWVVGAVVLIIMAAFLISFALANPDGSSRFSAQSFSGKAGLVIGIGVIILALYSGFWLVERKAWHSIWLLVIITFLVVVLTPFWLRLMIGFSRFFFAETAVGVIAGVIALVLTIYIVIRLGATTSFNQDLLDARTAVSDKEKVLQLKQDEVDSAQAQIAPMKTTKENAEAAQKTAEAAYEAAVKHREKKGKIRTRFVSQDKTVPAAESRLKSAKSERASTREQIDSLRKALKFTGSKDDLLPASEAALKELTEFDAKHSTPLTPTESDERELLVRRKESLKRLDTLLAQLATQDAAVKGAEKTLKKVTETRDSKSEVTNHVAALEAEQNAANERDARVADEKKATKKLKAKTTKVGELEEARDTLAAERDELQSAADTIESELGSNTGKFLLKISIAALLAMFLITGFVR